MIVYKLIDADGNGYELNGISVPAPTKGSMSPGGDEFSFDQDLIERTFLPGALKVGKGRLESRSYEFKAEFAFQTDSEYNTYINNLVFWLNKTDVLQDVTNERRADVVITEMDVSHEEGTFKRSGTISIEFALISGYWESDSETSQVVALSSGVNNVALTNNGFLEAFPELSFTFSDVTIDQLDIYIDETKQGLQLKDPTLGSVGFNDLVIDCRVGTLQVEDFDRSQYITEGTGYFSIPVGNNTLVVETPDIGDLTIKYRERYYT